MRRWWIKMREGACILKGGGGVYRKSGRLLKNSLVPLSGVPVLGAKSPFLGVLNLLWNHLPVR